MIEWKQTAAVTAGGGTAVYSGSAGNVFGQLAAGLKFTEYLILTVAGTKYAFAAAITAMNDDPAAELFIERTVTVPPAAYAGALSAVAFSGDGTAEAVTVAAGGENVADGVTVTVRLTLSLSGDAVFTAGSNALARALLGAAALSGSFTLCRGTDARAGTIRRGTERISDVFPAVTAVSADGATFTAVFDAGVIPELVLCLDGVPVMRAPALETAYATAPRQASAANGVAALPGPYTLGVFAVSSGGAAVDDYDVLYDAYAAAGPYDLSVRLPAGAETFSDAGGNWLGFFNDREAVVLDGACKPVLAVPGGVLADLAADGAAALFDGAELRVYAAGAQYAFEAETPDDFRFERAADGAYHFVMLYGGTMKRYVLADGALTLAETAETGQPNVVLHDDGGRLAYGGPDKSEVLGGGVRDELRSAYLAALLAAAGGTASLAGGCGQFAAVTESAVRVFDLVHGEVLSLDRTADSTADCALLGRAVLVTEEGQKKIAVRTRRPEGLARLADCPAETTAAGLCGDVLVCADTAGEAVTYELLKEASALYSPDFGETVTFYERYAADPSGTGGTQVTLTIAPAGQS